MKKSFIAVLAAVFAVCFLGCKPEIEIHEHTFSKDWSYDEDYHWHEATCSHSEQVSGKEKHKWDLGKVTTEPTEDSVGEKTFTCTVCKKIKKEDISKLEHVHKFSEEWTILYDSAADGKVEREKICTGCGYKMSDLATYRSETKYIESYGNTRTYIYVNEKVAKMTVIDNDGFITCVIEYNSYENEIKQSINAPFSNECLVYHKYEYDNDQNLIKESYYNNNDDLWGYIIYEYDSNGIKTKYTQYNSDDSVSYLRIYDSNGNIVSETNYSSDGVIWCKTEYYSDKSEKRNWYNSDGSISHIEYIDANYNIKDVYYNSNGKIDSYYTFERDEDDRMTECTRYNSDGTEIIFQYMITKGIGLYVYINSDGSMDRIEEYDSDYKNIKSIKFNSDGSVFFEYEGTGHINYVCNETETVDFITIDNSNGRLETIIKYDSAGSILYQYTAAEGYYLEIHYTDDYRIAFITEQRNVNESVKYIQFKSDGTISLLYAAEEGNNITVSTNSEGLLISIQEYNNATDCIKYVKYNSDGNIICQYIPEEGNYIYVNEKEGLLNFIEEMNYKTLVKTTYYNPDGSVKDVITD